MRTLYDILEDMKFRKNIELEFTIHKSFHASQRQSRHGDDEMSFISDDEILEEVKRASKNIIEDIINDHIDIDDRFIVQDTNTSLNIVCQLHRGDSEDKLRVDIVTVIKTDEFWNTKKNWIVRI